RRDEDGVAEMHEHTAQYVPEGGFIVGDEYRFGAAGHGVGLARRGRELLFFGTGQGNLKRGGSCGRRRNRDDARAFFDQWLDDGGTQSRTFMGTEPFGGEEGLEYALANRRVNA